MDVPPVHYVLYLSRLLSAWGDRLWSFLSALFMLVLQVQGGLRATGEVRDERAKVTIERKTMRRDSR